MDISPKDYKYNHFKIAEDVLVRQIKADLEIRITKEIVKSIVEPEVKKMLNSLKIDAAKYTSHDSFREEMRIYCEFKGFDSD